MKGLVTAKFLHEPSTLHTEMTLTGDAADATAYDVGACTKKWFAPPHDDSGSASAGPELSSGHGRRRGSRADERCIEAASEAFSRPDGSGATHGPARPWSPCYRRYVQERTSMGASVTVVPSTWLSRITTWAVTR